MSNDTRLTYFNKIKENILKISNAETINESTLETTLYDIYTEIKTDINSLTEYYSNITSLEVSTSATLCIVIIDMIYMSEFNKLAGSYKNISELVSELLSDDSDIMSIINSIEDHYIIYSSAESTDIKNSEKSQIEKLLLQLYSLLSELLVSIGIIPSSFNIDTDTDTGDITVTSDLARSINADSKNLLSYNMWQGSVDRSGWVAQEANIFIQQKENNNNGPLYVSVPIAKIDNYTYRYDPKTFLNIINLRNYTSTFLTENDGSDENNTSNLIQKNSYIRCGSFFDANTTIQTEEMSFKIQYDSTDGTWSSGNISYFGNITDTDITIEFNFDNEDILPASYPNTKLSDSITVNRTFNFYKSTDKSSSVTYKLSGTLSYDSNLSNEKNTEISNYKNNNVNGYDLRPVSVYSGILSLENISIDYDSLSDEEKSSYDSDKSQMQRNVILEIRYNDSADSYKNLNDSSQTIVPDTYDLICYNDSSSSNSSLTVYDKDNLILPNFVIQFSLNNLEMNNKVTFDSDSEKAAEALLQLSKLSVDDNFETNFGDLWNIINTSKKSLTNELLNYIDNMNNLISTLYSLHSEYASTISSFDESTIEDFTNELGTITSDFSQYLSVDGFNESDLYNGTLYNNISEFILKNDSIFENALTEITNVRNELESLDFKTLLFVDSKNKGWNIGEIITLFYKLLTSSTSTAETLSNTTNAYKKYNIISFEKWLSDKFNKNNKSYNIPVQYKYYLYVFYVARLILSSNLSENQKYYNIVKENEYKLIMKFYTQYSTDGLDKNSADIISKYKDLGIAYQENDNSCVLNPELYNNLPGSELFNYIEIEDSLSSSTFINNTSTLSGIVYSGILNNKYNNILTILKDKIDFIESYTAMNIKDMLFSYYILLACKYLGESDEFEFDSIPYNLDTVNSLYDTFYNNIIVYLNYKDLYKSKNIVSTLYITEAE